MLIGNAARLKSGPFRVFGGANLYAASRQTWTTNGGLLNSCLGMTPQTRDDASVKFVSSIPVGYGTGPAWQLPITAGGMASGGGRIVGEGDITYGNLAGGLNGVAAIVGTGDITNAALALILSAVAALSGSGTLSAGIKGRLDAAAALSGAGDLSGALGALAGLSASLEGAGDIDAALLSALGSMAANIVVSGDLLNTANVADAILDAANGVENGLTMRQALRLIAAAVAGKVSGAGTLEITFRSAVSDDHDRIIATVDGSGNRTDIVADLTD